MTIYFKMKHSVVPYWPSSAADARIKSLFLKTTCIVLLLVKDNYSQTGSLWSTVEDIAADKGTLDANGLHNYRGLGGVFGFCLSIYWVYASSISGIEMSKFSLSIVINLWLCILLICYYFWVVSLPDCCFGVKFKGN